MRDVTVFQKKHQVGEGTYGYVSFFALIYMLKKKRLLLFDFVCFTHNLLFLKQKRAQPTYKNTLTIMI